MLKIAIIYFSAQGHTHQCAEAVAEGVRSAGGCEVYMHRIGEGDFKGGRWTNDAVLQQCNESHAIIFGTPTYMGGYSAQLKAFIDAASGIWFRQGWKDKVAAGFTHSMGLSGDKVNTLVGLVINAMQHSMIWVGLGQMVEGSAPDNVNRLSAWAGSMAQSEMNQEQVYAGDLKTATLLGKRVAETTKRWNK